MSKSINLDIMGFDKGVVSDYLILKNNEYNVTNSCSVLQNLIVDDHNNLIKRPGTNFFIKLDNNPIKVDAYEFLSHGIIFNFFDKYINIYILKDINNYEVQKIPTNWDAESIADGISIVPNSNDRQMYVFCAKVAPVIISFNDNLKATLSDLEFTDGPYLNNDNSNTTLNIQKYNDQVSIASSKTFFSSSDVGRYIKVSQDDLWGICKICKYEDDKNVLANVISPITPNDNVTVFKMSIFSKKQGYPSQGMLLGNRLYLIGSNNCKTVVVASKYNDFLNFAESTTVKSADSKDIEVDTVLYDNAISFSIPDAKQINWISCLSGNAIVGSMNGIFMLSPVNTDESISPYNFSVNKVSSLKSSKLYVLSDSGIFFVDIFQRSLHLLSFTNSLSIANVVLAVSKLISSKIVSVSLTYDQFPILWVVLEEGKILSGSVLSTGIAWSEQVIGNKVSDLVSSYVLDTNYILLVVSRDKLGVFMEYIKLSEMSKSYNDPVCFLDGKISNSLNKGIISNIPEIYEGENLAVFDSVSNQEFLSCLVQDSKINLPNININSSYIYMGYLYDVIYRSSCLYIPKNISYLGCNKKIGKIILNTINTNNIQISNVIDSSVSYNLSTLNEVNSYLNNRVIEINPNWNTMPNPQIEISQSSVQNVCICSININLDFLI